MPLEDFDAEDITGQISLATENVRRALEEYLDSEPPKP